MVANRTGLTDQINPFWRTRPEDNKTSGQRSPARPAIENGAAVQPAGKGGLDLLRAVNPCRRNSRRQKKNSVT